MGFFYLLITVCLFLLIIILTPQKDVFLLCQVAALYNTRHNLLHKTKPTLFSRVFLFCSYILSCILFCILSCTLSFSVCFLVTYCNIDFFPCFLSFCLSSSDIVQYQFLEYPPFFNFLFFR